MWPPPVIVRVRAEYRGNCLALRQTLPPGENIPTAVGCFYSTPAVLYGSPVTMCTTRLPIVTAWSANRS